MRFSYRLTENLAERELNTAEFFDDRTKVFCLVFVSFVGKKKSPS